MLVVGVELFVGFLLRCVYCLQVYLFVADVCLSLQVYLYISYSSNAISILMMFKTTRQWLCLCFRLAMYGVDADT